MLPGGARGPDSWARGEDTLQGLTVHAAAEHINNEAGMQTGSTSRASGTHAKSMLRGSDELTEAEHTSEVTGAQLDGTSDANSLGADLMGAEPINEATGKLPHTVLDASSRVTANLVAVNKDHTETLHAECGWEVGNAQSEHKRRWSLRPWSATRTTFAAGSRWRRRSRRPSSI